MDADELRHLVENVIVNYKKEVKKNMFDIDSSGKKSSGGLTSLIKQIKGLANNEDDQG